MVKNRIRVIKIVHLEFRVPHEYWDRNIEINIDDLPKIGWILINGVGEENIYFLTKAEVNGTVMDVKCFCKVR